MSEENVDLVRRLLEMFAKREHEAVFAFYAPDIEWDATAWESIAAAPADVGGGIAGLAAVYRGHEGVRTYWRRWLEAWKDLEFEVEGVLDAGDEVVALIRNQRQWGRHSGIVTENAAVRAGVHHSRWQGRALARLFRPAIGPRSRRAVGVGMSEENVEVVLDAFGRFEAGDMPGLAKLFDPDITTTAAEGWPEQGPWIGQTAVVAQYERLAADWTESRVLLTELVADVGDWVVVQFSWQGRGAQSGIETSLDVASAIRLRDSLMVEIHNRWTREEALEAAGLRE